MRTYKFGTILEFKKDWKLNHITFHKGEHVRVAYHDHKYGIELVHPQIRGVFEFKTNPMTAKEKVDEYFEIAEDKERKSIEKWAGEYIRERSEWTTMSVALFASRLISMAIGGIDDRSSN